MWKEIFTERIKIYNFVFAFKRRKRGRDEGCNKKKVDEWGTELAEENPNP